MSIFNKQFALALLERAVKTFCQTAAALLVANGTGLLETDWVTVASVSGMATVVSVLTSVGTGLVTDGGPSIGSAEVVQPAVTVPLEQASNLPENDGNLYGNP